MTDAVSPFAAACSGYSLQRAWMEVRSGRTVAGRQHGAGVDGVTIARWESNWPDRLRALQADLLQGTYEPSPLLRWDIPRREPGRTRVLAIPTVSDRVVQRAVKNVLEPIWEGIFLSCSHGFRPNRSVVTAVAQVLWHHATGLRWAADADIADCFDSIPHQPLLAQMESLDDPRLTDVIAAWLAIGATTPGRGLAQGSVISPLLANIYLHPFDVAMVAAGLALVRYADDLVVMCATQQDAEDAVQYVAETLARLGLAVNWDKAAVVPLGPRLQFLGAEFCA